MDKRLHSPLPQERGTKNNKEIQSHNSYRFINPCFSVVSQPELGKFSGKTRTAFEKLIQNF